MYAQNIYFLKNFSFSIAMKSWTQKKVQRATKQWQHPAKNLAAPFVKPFFLLNLTYVVCNLLMVLVCVC
jgi:hypothetical protein